MRALVKLSHFLDTWVSRVGRLAAWSGLALILVTVFDVVTRRFFVLGSTKLQEFEWHLHTVLFALCIGMAYLSDAHVRIDLVRDKLPPRAQWWLELTGVLVFLLPFCGLIVYFGVDFTVTSFLQNEASNSATGLPHRWIIKATIPIGFALLALAGVAIGLRKIVELFGTSDLRSAVRREEYQRAEGIDPDSEPGRGE